MNRSGMSQVPALLQQARDRITEAGETLQAQDFERAAAALRRLEELARWARYVLEASR